MHSALRAPRGTSAASVGQAGGIAAGDGFFKQKWWNVKVGEAPPTKLLPKKLCRDDIKFVYKNGKLAKAVIRIYPLKQSVRARKAGQKIPIAIPATAGPHLMMAAERLWLMVAPIVDFRRSARSDHETELAARSPGGADANSSFSVKQSSRKKKKE